jgi:hypothetical protein
MNLIYLNYLLSQKLLMYLKNQLDLIHLKYQQFQLNRMWLMKQMYLRKLM